MKKVLIFGAVKHAIEKAKELGYETILIEQDPNLSTIQLADKFKCIPYENYEECLKFAREEKVDGIVNATDWAVLSSSYVANKMNLPGLDFETAKLAKDKYQIRRKMMEKGISNVPQFYEIDNVEKVYELKDKIKFPVILKPCSGLGSLFVYKVDDFDTLVEKLPEVIEGSANKFALIETFIVGQEYGAESFVYNGKVHVLVITQKIITKLPYRSELSHITPSDLSPENEAKMKEVITNLINAIGIKQGPVNMDIIVSEDNEIYVVDVGARMGGNAITSHILPFAKGIDHTGNTIKLAMSEKDIDLEPKFNKCVVSRLLDLDEGIIEELPDFEKYMDDDVIEILFEKSVGDKIEEYKCNGNRCGFFVIQGDDIEKTKQKAIDLKDRINKDIKRK